jgi:hypothetical protein
MGQAVIIVRQVQGPSGGGGAGTVTGLSGDVVASGTGVVTASVEGIWGRAIASTTPTNGQVYTWSTGTSSWVPQAASGGISALTGDVLASGAGSVTASVDGLRGVVLATSMSAPTFGNVMQYGTGASTTQWTNTAPYWVTTISGDTVVTASTQTSTGLTVTLTTEALYGTAVASTAPTNGQVLTYSSGITKWTPATPSGGGGGSGGAGFGVYGTGPDGAVTLDGTTAYGPFLTKSGSTYTQVAGFYPTTLQVNASCILKCAGYPLVAQTSITTSSGAIIDCSSGSGGTNGSASAGLGGSGGPSGDLGGGFAGGAGGLSSIGSNGVTTSSSYVILTAASGVHGGAGGTGGVNAGGSGATVGLVGGRVDMLPGAAMGAFIGSNTGSFGVWQLQGGGGGGGGGSNGAGGGGGGGGSAGIGVICSPVIVNNGTIQSIGGSGGNGFTGTGAGGGGGGAGGLVFVVTGSYSGNAVSVAGGSGGTGASGGSSGTSGSTGAVVTLGP